MTRAEEYLRRMRALGYEPSLAGMDDEDVEWELKKMDEAERRRAAPQPVRTVYRPVDPGLAARILRQFGQPYDESAIPRGQKFYLNGWDDGEEEKPDGTDVNPYAGGYVNGGAEGDMLLPVATQQQPKQLVSAEQLKAFGWQNVDDDMVGILNSALGKYDITTPARIRHFLAQCAKETNKGESYTEQDYGDKTYFDRMYEGRSGIGNIYPGDGKKFIGGGAIHITGRDEYQKFADYVGDQEVMKGGAEYVAKKYPWVAAGRWWEKNRMNELVDGLKGEDHDADVDKVTGVVNPGDEQKARQQRKDYHSELRGIIKD